MNSRYLAGLSLAFMTGGFLITLFLQETPLVALLKGGFEAGLVGGIADWFAVTALFRHPFGIPVPHTSLLLKNRDKIIQSLILALENELLNKQSIENKLRQLQLLQLASSSLAKLLGKRKVRVGLLDLLIRWVHRLPLEKAIPYLQSEIAAAIRRADVESAADAILTKVIENRFDEKALNYVLHKASDWAKRPDTGMMLGKFASEKLSEVKAGGLTGFALQAFVGFMDEEKLGSFLQNLMLSGIRGLQHTDNAFRKTLVQEIRIQLSQLADNELLVANMKEWIVNQLEGARGAVFLHERLSEIRNQWLDKLEEDRLKGGRAVITAYRWIVRNFNPEQDSMAVWENRLLAYLIEWVEANHYRIGQLVKENLDQMDDVALVRMLEHKVGKDLQWIRVNGALCGFAVGIVLSLIQL
ncbi:DUF445 domain-containing protein [Paenibacillus naphthalenovorans]|uniref:DUF445 domain-containing protein n=1 Tax=Paenibacillus naphthalenovorans TaxID=162209 RepID=UPI00088FB6F4|nr:DUF445 domain-containing protein [Paenibacillus naphthalenovorans]SDJ47515.1 Uncharacterized membrane-anchored protein YjiN, DUF445 family [Paenibacillus naphthalenovorans]